MWESKYGKEPADLKLLAIQFYRKSWIVFVSALLGGILFGTGYFIRNVVLAPEPSYEAHAMLYVDFVESDEGGPKYYAFNTGGWSGFVKTDEILDRAIAYLQKDENAAALTNPIDKEEMRESVKASVDADYRVVDLIVTNADPERAVMISHAIEKGFLDFGEAMKEIEQIRIMTTADKADRIMIDTDTYRAIIWGAIITSVIVMLIMAIQTILDDSIYVPITFERRYGIPMLGATMASRRPADLKGMEDSFQKARNAEINTNYEYLCTEEKMAVLTVSTDMADMKEYKDIENAALLQIAGLPKVMNLLQHPEEIKKLTQYEGVIMEVPAGRHNGRIIEYTIAQTEKFDCKVKAAILIHADEKLLKTYYFGSNFSKGK